MSTSFPCVWKITQNPQTNGNSSWIQVQLIKICWLQGATTVYLGTSEAEAEMWWSLAWTIWHPSGKQERRGKRGRGRRKTQTFQSHLAIYLSVSSGFWRQDLIMQLWLSWNSLYRPGKLWTHRDPPASSRPSSFQFLEGGRWAGGPVLLPSIGITALRTLSSHSLKEARDQHRTLPKVLRKWLSLKCVMYWASKQAQRSSGCSDWPSTPWRGQNSFEFSVLFILISPELKSLESNHFSL